MRTAAPIMPSTSADRFAARVGHWPRSGSRRGLASIYIVATFFALLGFVSLAVDYGRVQSAKSELQSATDGAARYAASGMRSTMMGTSGAIANASSVMAKNRVDGSPAPFDAATDLTLGIWNASAKTFTPTTVVSAANAVKLNTKLWMGGSSHPLTFLSVFSRGVTIHATSIASVAATDASTFVSAKGNMWLSGMPAGTVSTDFRSSSSEWDTAGSAANDQSSPAMVSLGSLGTSSGASMTFDGVTGSTNFGGGTTGNADGDSTLICTLGSPSFGDYTYFNSPTNGIANIKSPVNALVAVFLDDNAPNTTSAPSPLDFSTSASRDYNSLSPQLKQTFFVGDGRTSTGEVQQIIIPTGATRLFIANMDGWQYNNNTGGFNLSIHATQTISSVYAD